MPIIRVEMFKGRTREQKRKLVKEVTDAFVRTCGGTPKGLTVVITEIKQEDWGSAGELICDRTGSTRKLTATATAKAIECDYTIEGKGPPLFLIHGIGAARDTWRFAMPKLAQHFTVISYDLRGHGTSPMPDGEITLDDLVADLENLRDRLGIKKAHFAGHSLGGMIGPAYARKYPDRVLSLGLYSTTAGRTEQDSKNVWAVVHAMEAKGIENILPTLKDRWYTDAFLEANPDIVEQRMKQITGMSAKVFMNVFRIYAGTDMLPWLNEIKVPCQILTGENDGGCNPRLNRLIDAELENSELVILPVLKHSILLEDGENVADHIVRFIEGV